MLNAVCTKNKTVPPSDPAKSNMEITILITLNFPKLNPRRPEIKAGD
jgi:hypothetical protein